MVDYELVNTPLSTSLKLTIHEGELLGLNNATS
jgi:hypothetical protein